MQTTVPYTSARDLKKWLLDVLPNQGNWSEGEYLWLTDTRIASWSSPTAASSLARADDRHQTILQFLLLALNAFVEPLAAQ